MAGVLDGIRVFDLTLAAVGPWSAKLLGQLGADVIHVEGPEPELAHQIPPTVRGTGVLYLAANTNKRSVVLDLKQDGDRERALSLAASCDVFIQNMRPGAVGRLGLGYEAVAARRPDIVYVSASAYGRVGPMATEAGVDPLVQAFCGWTSVTGARGSSGELFRHYAHLDLTTSSMVVEAVLAALAVRDRDGTGQHVELEMLAAALSLQTSRLAEYAATGVAPVPLGSASASTAPHQAFRCSDGRWLTVGVERDDQWPRLCAALGTTELAEDRGLDTNAGRLARRDELAAALDAVMATRPSAWWAIRCSRHGVPHARPSDFDELRHHPQIRANGHLTDVSTDRYGPLTLDGLPWHFAATPADPPRPGADPGTHTAEVLAALGTAAAPTSSGAGSPVQRPHGPGPLAPPLDGVLVVELAEGQAGAFAAARLGDLGAEVIKIERPGGDPVRGHGPELGATGMGAVFAALNRNKRSVVLDLKREQARRALLRLIDGADVLVHNMRVGAAERLGLSYAALAPRNPRLIHASATGFRKDGRHRDRPAFDDVIQAAGGIAALPSYRGQDPAYVPGVVADKVAGLTATYGVMAAIAARARGKTGPIEVEAAMFESVAAFVLNEHLAAATFGGPPQAAGYHRMFAADRRPYRTQDGWIAALPYTGQQWRRLLEFTNRHDILGAPWFDDPGERSAHIAELYTVLAEEMPRRTTADWLEALQRLDIPHARVNRLEDLLTDPHLQDVDFYAPNGTGLARSARQPVTYPGLPQQPDRPAPALGADAGDVLAMLGYDAAGAATLRAAGALG